MVTVDFCGKVTVVEAVVATNTVPKLEATKFIVELVLTTTGFPVWRFP